MDMKAKQHNLSQKLLEKVREKSSEVIESKKGELARLEKMKPDMKKAKECKARFFESERKLRENMLVHRMDRKPD